MRMELPLCNLKTCRYCFDGNCIEKIMYEQCEYTLAKQERPQSEWIKFTLEGGFLSSYKCLNCGFNGNQLWHFCPSCGAEMRVKNELNRVSKELNSEIEKSKSEIVPDYRDGWRLREGEAK